MSEYKAALQALVTQYTKNREYLSSRGYPVQIDHACGDCTTDPVRWESIPVGWKCPYHAAVALLAREEPENPSIELLKDMCHAHSGEYPMDPGECADCDSVNEDLANNLGGAVCAYHAAAAFLRKHSDARPEPAAADTAREWRPIESAPTDGTPILLANEQRGGPWIGYYCPVYESGYRPDNPWSSLMLNMRWHNTKWASWVPTLWQPLPPPPAATNQE